MFYVGSRLARFSRSLADAWRAFFSSSFDDTTVEFPPKPLYSETHKDIGLAVASVVREFDVSDEEALRTVLALFSSADPVFARTGIFSVDGFQALSCVVGCLDSISAPSPSAQRDEAEKELAWLENLSGKLPSEAFRQTLDGASNPFVYTLLQWAGSQWSSVSLSAAGVFIDILRRALVADPRLDVVGPPDRMRFEASVYQIANACKRLSGAFWHQAQTPVFRSFMELLPLLDASSVGDESGLRAGAVVRAFALFDKIPDAEFISACRYALSLSSFDPKGPSGPLDSGGSILALLLGWRGRPAGSQVPFSTGEGRKLALALPLLVELGADPNLPFSGRSPLISEAFCRENERPLGTLARLSEAWGQGVDDIVREQISALVSSGASLRLAFGDDVFSAFDGRSSSKAFVRALIERDELSLCLEEDDERGGRRRRGRI